MCTTAIEADAPVEPTEAQEADDAETGLVTSATASPTEGGPGETDDVDVSGVEEDGTGESDDEERETHWIAIELKYDNGDPVVNEPYEIILPDGSKRPGSTNSEGKAREENIPDSGQCEVNFTRICKKEWKKS
jgi:hypothetical protein